MSGGELRINDKTRTGNFSGRRQNAITNMRKINCHSVRAYLRNACTLLVIVIVFSGNLSHLKMIFAEGQKEGLSTLAMVVILTIAVKGVFLCFAVMAVCYRYRNKGFVLRIANIYFFFVTVLFFLLSVFCVLKVLCLVFLFSSFFIYT